MFWNRLVLATVLVLSGAVVGYVFAQPGQTSTSTSTVPKEDCLPYDPASLRIEPDVGGTWLLTDGRSRMAMFETQLDATNGLAVALRHTAQCFIGRRRDRLPGVAVINYWNGRSAITPPIAPESCVSYTSSSLKGVDAGADGWLVTDGEELKLRVTDAHDAATLLSVAKRFSAYCSIGPVTQRSFPHYQGPFHYFR